MDQAPIKDNMFDQSRPGFVASTAWVHWLTSLVADISAAFSGAITSVLSISVDTTLGTGHSMVMTTGAITVTLPTAVGIKGKMYVVKKMDAVTTLTIAAAGAETIDGAASITRTTQYSSVSLVSDGANWELV